MNTMEIFKLMLLLIGFFRILKVSLNRDQKSLKRSKLINNSRNNRLKGLKNNGMINKL